MSGAWRALLPRKKVLHDSGPGDLCEALGLSLRAIGHADNNAMVVGYTIARAYNGATDVASVGAALLDVPENARAKVVRLLTALGITEEPRVILVACHE